MIRTFSVLAPPDDHGYTSHVGDGAHFNPQGMVTIHFYDDIGSYFATFLSWEEAERAVARRGYSVAWNQPRRAVTPVGHGTWASLMDLHGRTTTLHASLEQGKLWLFVGEDGAELDEQMVRDLMYGFVAWCQWTFPSGPEPSEPGSVALDAQQVAA